MNEVNQLDVTIKVMRNLVVNFFKAGANPKWIILTSHAAGGDVFVSLAPSTESDLIRRIHYVKISHNDVGAKVFAYNWLDAVTTRRSIKATSAVGGTSLLLLPADMEFPVICSPSSTLECSANSLTAGKVLTVTALVSDMEYKSIG